MLPFDEDQSKWEDRRLFREGLSRERPTLSPFSVKLGLFARLYVGLDRGSEFLNLFVCELLRTSHSDARKMLDPFGRQRCRDDLFFRDAPSTVFWAHRALYH